MALMRLYYSTADRKYLILAKYFIEERGKHQEYVDQKLKPINWLDHIPVREMATAEGHAVRAMYLYSAMADLALHENDVNLQNVCANIFNDIVTKKMYITGGIGSSFYGERFTIPFDLPNSFAYCETCAAIAFAFFCLRLSKIENKSIYHEIIEKLIYNNILAAESMDGKSFFYVNPLEMHKDLYDYNETLSVKQFYPLPQRVEVFDCSCCPPNFTRFIESIGNYIYGKTGKGIYINQYISSKTEIDNVSIDMKSEMPFSGKIRIIVTGKPISLYCRVPLWSNSVKIWINGKIVLPEIVDGYYKINCLDYADIRINFKMCPHFVYANSHVWHDAGRKAVQYGPLILCGESVDNGEDLRAVRISQIKNVRKINGRYFLLELDAERLVSEDALYSINPPQIEKMRLKLIPYFLWANRGKGDMQLWWL